MKQIKIEEINVVLEVVYKTNISAQNFDAIKHLFSNLPDVKVTDIPEGITQADVIPSEVTDH